MRHRDRYSSLLEAMSPLLEAAGLHGSRFEPVDQHGADAWHMRFATCGMTATLHARRFDIEIDLIDACGPPLEIREDLDIQAEALRLETLRALHADDVETAANLTASMFEHLLAEHSHRARAAALLALPTCGAADTVMDHVRLDAWTAERLTRLHGRHADDFAARACAIITRIDNDGRAAVDIDSDGTILHSCATLAWIDDLPVPMITVPLDVFDPIRDGFISDDGPVFNGRQLHIEQDLPEAVLAAAIGRQLGDVVRTGTVLDERIIVGGTCVEGLSFIDLRPIPVAAVRKA